MAHSSLMGKICHFRGLFCCCSSAQVRQCRHIKTSAYLHRKKSSSHQWLNRQRNDPFVKQASRENWRCRSAYKLLEIDGKFDILKPGCTVIDCGAAPGSWTQVAVQRVCSASEEEGFVSKNKVGKVISIDLQRIEPIHGAIIFDRCDFTSSDTQTKILDELGGKPADVVLSDMAPSATGTPSLDHDMIIELCLSVLKFCTVVLGDNGCVVCKIWMGGDQEKLKHVMERMFRKVRFVKPEASRSDSAELFLVGQEYFLRKT